MRSTGLEFFPNAMTTANLLCGFLAIVWTIESILGTEDSYREACMIILIAMVFDMLDGRIARLINHESQFGLYYDTLADLCTFGLAPAIIMYGWGLREFGNFGILAAFIFFACGALRLARFNVLVARHQTSKRYFRGLPIPSGAAMIVTSILCNRYFGGVGNSAHHYLLALAPVVGLLMVSNVRFRSFKEFDLGSKVSFRALILFTLFVVVIALKFEVTLCVAYAAYLTFGIAEEILYWRKRGIFPLQPFIEEDSEFIDETKP